jgi:glycine cleavage system regulatory protein
MKLFNKKFADEIGIASCETIENAFKLINMTIHTIMVVSGADGAIIVPMIAGHLKRIDNVKSIVVFCINTEAHSKWASNYPDLVKLVSSDIREVVNKVGELV